MRLGRLGLSEANRVIEEAKPRTTTPLSGPGVLCGLKRESSKAMILHVECNAR